MVGGHGFENSFGPTRSECPVNNRLPSCDLSVGTLPAFCDRELWWRSPSFTTCPRMSSEIVGSPQNDGNVATESAGISRLVVGNERVQQRRLSQLLWPRVVRWPRSEGGCRSGRGREDRVGAGQLLSSEISRSECRPHGGFASGIAIGEMHDLATRPRPCDAMSPCGAAVRRWLEAVDRGLR